MDNRLNHWTYRRTIYATDEIEAHWLIKRTAEREVPGATVTILSIRKTPTGRFSALVKMERHA
jgi:hypothetical protein